MDHAQLGERILAMFALSAIGDALGAPVEIWSAKKIRAQYGRLTDFVADPSHKFGPIKKGETTDDTQLTLAIARSIANVGGLDLAEIAREHVAELHKTTRGWGGSTTLAVKHLADGVHWLNSGTTADKQNKKRGKGNGVAMKISPLGAYYAAKGIDPFYDRDAKSEIRSLAVMTHATDMGYASGLAQTLAIRHVLTEVVTPASFASVVTGAALIGETFTSWYERRPGDDLLSDRFRRLAMVTDNMLDDELRIEFGNGSCYVFESLPLAYALFLRKPTSVEALFDAVNFGGDTDTVAAIVGALLGAYNGMSIVPRDLWSRVDRYDEIVDLVTKFNALLGVS